MANKQARALTDGVVNGVAFRCNDVVEGDAKVIAGLESGGQVDSNNAAVKYARSLSDKVVVLAGDAETTEAEKTA